jgi:hypothetical protein
MDISPLQAQRCQFSNRIKPICVSVILSPKKCPDQNLTGARCNMKDARDEAREQIWEVTICQRDLLHIQCL